MGLRKYLRTFRGERIDQPDFEHGTFRAIQDGLAQLLYDFVIGPPGQNTVDQPSGFVLSGFAVSGSTTVEITAGTAILGYRRRGESAHGFLVGRDSSARSIPISGYTNGTYAVWIRGVFTETDNSNRLAHNPYASPDPTETVKHGPTRYTESWDAVVEPSTVTPGAEWTKIAEVTISGGAITATVDHRQFFFEGTDADAHVVVDGEWGEVATDRDADRPNYGVFGLYRAIRGLQRQVQDVIGEPSGGWWSEIDRNLLQLLALDGSRDMTGNLLPDADDTLNLGGAFRRWANVFAAHATIGTLEADLVQSNTYLEGGGDVVEPGSVTLELVLKFNRLRVYQYSNNDAATLGFMLVYNAEWNSGGGVWDYLYSATKALRVLIDADGVQFQERTGATGWADVAWTSRSVLGHDVDVTGDTTLAGTLDVTGDTTLAGTLDVTGAATAASYALSASTNWYRSFLVLPTYHASTTSLVYVENAPDMDASSYSSGADYLLQGDFSSSSLTDDFVIMVPLDGLPNGATMTNFRINSWWVDATVTYTVQLICFRTDQADPDPTVIATINGLSTGGSVYEAAASSSFSHVIDLSTRAYAVRIQSADTAGQRRFGAIRVSGTTAIVSV